MSESVIGETNCGGDLLASRVAMAQEAAAGGICSLRVLRVLHAVNEYVGDEADEVEAYCNSFEHKFSDKGLTVLGTSRTSGGLTLAADERVFEDGVISQNVFLLDHRTKAALPLWRLIEEPPESPNCSRSIFWPALAGDDMDWSQVVTSRDERAAMNLEQSVQADPITNASVLELLQDALKKEDSLPALNKLLELVKARELWTHNIVGIDPFTDGEYASSRNVPDLLYQEARRRMTWLALGQGKYAASTPYTPQPDSLVRFTLDPTEDSDRMAVSVEFMGLGTNGSRHQPLGSLVIHEAMRNEPEFVVGGDNRAPVGEAKQVTGYAEAALNVPEFVQSEQLTANINRILQQVARGERDVQHLDKHIHDAVLYIRSDLHHDVDNVVNLDLGEFDIRGLEISTLFGLLPACSLYRATVYADETQDVFAVPSGQFTNLDLYDCTVTGAKSAFNGRVLGARGCVANDVQFAFENVRSAKDCVAVGAVRAFHGHGNYTGNLAEGCDEAFEAHGRNDAIFRQNVAKNCTIAFNGKALESVGNTVIGKHRRKTAFYDAKEFRSIRKRYGNKVVQA